TALIVALAAVAAMAGSHEEFTAEMKAELDAKISALTPEAQTAAKTIKGYFEANEGNKEDAMGQTKTFMATLPESIVAEIKSIMPEKEKAELAAGAAPSRARRQAEPAATDAPSPAVEAPEQ
ncbi:hypothetical protein PENTCL1PPCAC_25492, partial [Pristionchus entomophagus]